MQRKNLEKQKAFRNCQSLSNLCFLGGNPLNFNMCGEMEMMSHFSKQFSLAFSRISFSPETSPLPSQSSLPFLSLQIMLSHFGEETGATGGWGQRMAVSFLPFITSFCHCPFLFVSSALVWAFVWASFPQEVSWSACLQPCAQCLLPDVSSHVSCCAFLHILLCLLPTAAIALF